MQSLPARDHLIISFLRKKRKKKKKKNQSLPKRLGTPAGGSAQPSPAPPIYKRPPRNKTHHEALHYLTRPRSPTASANAASSPGNGPSSGATQLTGNVLHKLQGDVISGLGRAPEESISRCSGLGDEPESQRKRLQNDRPACYRSRCFLAKIPELVLSESHVVTRFCHSREK